jgi:hypothetical protein
MEQVIDKKSECMVLYSGGYDSVAVLHKLILLEKYHKIVAVMEISEQIITDYEIDHAKKSFNKLKKIADRNNVELVLIEEKIDLGWANPDYPYSNYNQDLLLLLHTSTILKYGQYKEYYLGWEHHVFEELDISKKLIKWFNKNSIEGYKIYMLNELFLSNSLEQSKYYIVDYLLRHNIFDLGFTSELWETKEERSERKYWWKNNKKENAIAKSLISIKEFDSEDISKIFLMKTTKEIQKYYNELTQNAKKADE